jgi:hypothetical protein
LRYMEQTYTLPEKGVARRGQTASPTEHSQGCCTMQARPPKVEWPACRRPRARAAEPLDDRYSITRTGRCRGYRASGRRPVSHPTGAGVTGDWACVQRKAWPFHLDHCRDAQVPKGRSHVSQANGLGRLTPCPHVPGSERHRRTGISQAARRYGWRSSFIASPRP